MTTFCFECKRKIGTLEARGTKKMIILRGGFPPENMGENDVLCEDCWEPIRKSIESMKTSQKQDSMERPTRLLYLVPIFMGLLGGILMYIAVKEKNQEMANDGMFWGVISSIVIVLIYGLIMFLGLVNMSRMSMFPF